KRAVEIAFMPWALEHGATIVSDALAERVLVERGRAVGIEGRLLGGQHGAPAGKFRVRARAVVLSCGTIHTPGLLQRLGLRAPGVGRHITLHPGARVVARFPDRLDWWDGALQSVYSDAFHHD